MESKNEKKIPVRLTISGVQKDIDGEPVVQKMQGLLSRRGESIYIQYTEEEGLSCLMKLTPSRVEIKRGGVQGVLLFFERDAVCRTFYTTPSGKLEAEFRTREVKQVQRFAESNPGPGSERVNISAFVAYTLLINGDKVSECELNIEIRN